MSAMGGQNHMQDKYQVKSAVTELKDNFYKHIEREIEETTKKQRES
jgi:hypothetical protein